MEILKMRKKKLLNIFLFFFLIITTVTAYPFFCSNWDSYFYGNLSNTSLIPHNEKEKILISYADTSFKKAMNRSSKLNELMGFEEDTKINSVHGVIPYYHLLNNLNSIPFASHLHIGLYTGGSFVGAIYGNQDTLSSAVGIDWFQEDWGYKKICYDSCNKFLSNYDYKIIESDCFAIDKSIFQQPINVYVYDADHSKLAHEKAFTYYNDVLDDLFIAVVDDWEWEDVRQGTFNAFDKLGYVVLYQNKIPGHEKMGNGQYIAVIRKS